MAKKRTAKDSELDDIEEPSAKRQRTDNSSPKMQQLLDKYKKKQQENLKLKESLLTKVMGIGDNSNFPNVEEFVKEYKVFINQTHNNLLNALLDILEEFMENDDDEDDDVDMTSNKKEDNDEEIPDIDSMKIQKIVYEMLFNIIYECYKAMVSRKDKFYGVIRELLHLKAKKSVNQKISMFIDTYLQIKWSTFVENKYYTMKLSENLNSKKKRKPNKKKVIKLIIFM